MYRKVLQKQLYIVSFLIYFFLFTVIEARVYVRTFGDIASSSNFLLPKKGIFEEIILYPKKNEHSTDHIARKGFLIRYPNAIGTVIICHGFMCDKHDVGMLRKIFKPGLYNVLTFDFRAHGEDIEGQHCTFGKDESLDVTCAVHFVKNHPYIKEKPVILYAFSMGTSAGIEAQAKAQSEGTNLFDAMILDCPPDSSENMIKRGLENLTFSFLGYEFSLPGRYSLQEYAFHPYVQGLVKTVLKSVSKLDSRNVEIDIHPVNPIKSIENIAVPCFFIHCKNDEIIPVTVVKEMYRRTKGPKQLWITGGRNHFDSYFYDPEQYTMRVRTFLSQVLSNKKKLLSELIIEDTEKENM